MTTPTQPPRVLLGVCGGIAAYKAAHIVRGLVASGAEVQVIATRASFEFVGRATWEALSHREVLSEVFEHVDRVAHVRAGQEADLVLVAPATADLLARARAGRADDLLTASLLVARCPVVLAPAMHTEMWEHPATRENVAVLRERGAIVLEPASGRLTGPDTGPGRLPEPAAILAAAASALDASRTEAGGIPQDLAGRRLLISAGGTREALDPVRFLANRSSGKQGFALAQAALLRGAEVELVAANADLETPPGAHRTDVESAAELARAVTEKRGAADTLIMAAAVADFTAASRAAGKIKKTDDQDVPTLALRRTEDVLATATAAPDRPAVVVGFAAETGDEDADALEHARRKARRKGADLLVLNDVTTGVFGHDENRVLFLDGAGEVLGSAQGSKSAVAHRVLDRVADLLPDVPSSS